MTPSEGGRPPSTSETKRRARIREHVKKIMRKLAEHSDKPTTGKKV